MSASVKTESRAQSTEVIVTGTLDEVLQHIEEEMVNYDPRGYGTNAIIGHNYLNQNGTFLARITRSNSCD